VKEWWNTNGKNYATPSAHLFEQLHISPAGKESYAYGKGVVTIVKQDPKELVLTAGGDENFMRIVKSNYESATTKGSLQTNNYFYLERGPYDIASVMEESVSTEPLHIQGPVIDMFDPALPVLKEKIVPPGQQSLLYDLKRVKQKNIPQVLCAASRVYDEKRNGNEYSFITKSPSNTNNVMRILLQAKPTSVITKDKDGKTIENKSEWDEGSYTILLQFINSADGIGVEIR
jgi:hypothetical protein